MDICMRRLLAVLRPYRSVWIGYNHDKTTYLNRSSARFASSGPSIAGGKRELNVQCGLISFSDITFILITTNPLAS
ncbi:hypothetical protein SERLA73DRAFT_136416 [Serpula lacrymans var. lacrymans S7.3]|uniref:Uncharacterized protein n=2 Tax=Serpula lacrymans var. lacrymans TaxID=341189 RepID=F8PV49_SERL3|nr:uncharacterized protein SERLADRAFT_388912 [Serpula lacrymans var. lacrymans S7.9]EGO00501.1 hypothetical protein SERLA73DRAFT_136416 [Serpula lacrymans var. lacrymans S7.3]EGO26049.1 hypothetical protein SERLADRAFT_388912 [Serpula lacrymans var. lacrymans S7.9]